MLVRIRVGEIIDIGEAPAELWWTGQDASSVRNATGQYLAPALVGTPGEPRAATSRTHAATAANPYAKAAIEMALWSSIGQPPTCLSAHFSVAVRCMSQSSM